MGAGPTAPVLVSRSAAGPARPAVCFAPEEPVEQFEAHAAVNPRDPAHVVAVWMTGDDRARWVVEASQSRDGGRTWSRPVTPPVSRCAGGSREWITSFHDEWVAVGPDGRVYLASLVARWGEAYHGGVQVVTSPDGGTSWDPAAVVVESTDRRRSFDNTTVTADPTRPGTAYVLTTEYVVDVPSADPAQLPPGLDLDRRLAGRAALARTRDAGATWSPLRPATPLEWGRRVSAPMVVVDPRHGALTLVYFVGDNRDKANAAIETRRSTDGGESWSEAVRVASFVPMKGEPRAPLTELRIETGEDIVSAAVDPRTGALYVAYADASATGGERLQVSLSRSGDGGRTWSEPARVSVDPEVMAWLPAVAVGGDGTVSVAYLDLSDSEGRQFATLPTNVRRRAVQWAGGRLVPGEDEVIDRFNHLGAVYVNALQTSDYLAQVVTSQGFLAVYARSNCGPYSVSCAGLPGSGARRDLMDVYAR